MQEYGKKINDQELGIDTRNYNSLLNLRSIVQKNIKYPLGGALLDTAAIPFDPQIFIPLFAFPGGTSLVLGIIMGFASLEIKKIERKYS